MVSPQQPYPVRMHDFECQQEQNNLHRWEKKPMVDECLLCHAQIIIIKCEVCVSTASLHSKTTGHKFSFSNFKSSSCLPVPVQIELTTLILPLPPFPPRHIQIHIYAHTCIQHINFRLPRRNTGLGRHSRLRTDTAGFSLSTYTHM